MSWFKRLRSFVEDEEILAPDFEAEFDNIAEGFNGLFTAERVAMTGNLSLSGAWTDVPGTSRIITLDRDSLVLVSAVAASDSTFENSSQVYCLSLSVGSHTLKLRAKQLSNVDAEVVLNVDGANQGPMMFMPGSNGTISLFATHTGYTFLVVPA